MAKRIFAWGMALCLVLHPMCLPAYASEREVETVVNGGLTTKLTTTTETDRMADGATTVVVTIERSTEGTDENGASVTAAETAVEKSVTDEEAQVLEESLVTDGRETTEYTESVTPEDTQVPAVDVTLQPGETVTERVEDTTTTVTGDVPVDENDTEYDYTETTTEIVREVATETSDIVTTEEAAGDVTLEAVQPEDYEGKSHIIPDQYGPASSVLKYCDVVTVTEADGTETEKWVPRLVRADEEMPDYLKAYYDYDSESGQWTPKAAEGKYTYQWEWDYVLAEQGETSTAGQAVANQRYQDTANFVLYDEYGERVYAYCMDSKVSTGAGKTYVVENLEDTDYFSDEEAKSHIRAIALNGYWGNESGAGSFAELQKGLTEALKNGLQVRISYTDGSVTYDYDSSDPEDLAALLDMAANINEGEALAATQGALWAYGRDSAHFDGFNPYRSAADDAENIDGVWHYTHGGPEARMTLIWEYLTSLTAEQSESTLIEPDSMLAEDGIRLTVKEQVSDAEANRDADKSNDIYHVDLSFALVVEPSTEKGDDMIVKLIDNEGRVVRIARLAGDGSKDEGFDTVKQNGNSFTFEDLQLAENSDITFDLRLEGLQHLEQGVYIYKSTKGYEGAQTLVGVSKGTHEFAVQTSFTVSFDVEEEKTVLAERVWHRESRTEYEESEPDPEVTPEPEETENGTTAQASDVPKTGDDGGKWVLLFSGSCFALSVLTIYMIRRTEE